MRPFVGLFVSNFRYCSCLCSVSMGVINLLVMYNYIVFMHCKLTLINKLSFLDLNIFTFMFCFQSWALLIKVSVIDNRSLSAPTIFHQAVGLLINYRNHLRRTSHNYVPEAASEFLSSFSSLPLGNFHFASLLLVDFLYFTYHSQLPKQFSGSQAFLCAFLGSNRLCSRAFEEGFWKDLQN